MSNSNNENVVDVKTAGKVPDFATQAVLYQFINNFASFRGKNQFDGDRAAEAANVVPSGLKNVMIADPTGESPMSFTQDLNNAAAQSLLENVPKEILSSLQPVVEVYKVINQGAGKTKDILLPFSNFKDPRKMDPLNRYAGRSPGHLAVGLREFSFDYLGTQPAEVDYFINCKLRLYCSSMDAFFHEYTNKQGDKVSFSDLIKRPVVGKHREYNHKDFRIRVDVRYLTPDKSVLRDMIKNLGIQKKNKKEFMNNLHAAIKNSSTSFFLTLVRHEIEFATDVPSMPFEITIDYNGSVESALLSDDADLLRTIIPKGIDQKVSLSDEVKAFEKFVKDNPEFSNLELEIKGDLQEALIKHPSYSGTAAAGSLLTITTLLKDNNRIQFDPKDTETTIEKVDKFVEFAKLVKAKNKAAQDEGIDDITLRATAYNQILSRLMGRNPRLANLRAQRETAGLPDNLRARELNYQISILEQEDRDNRIYRVNIGMEDMMDWVHKRALTAYSTAETSKMKQLKRDLKAAKRKKDKESEKAAQKEINKLELDLGQRRQDLQNTASTLAAALKNAKVNSFTDTNTAVKRLKLKKKLLQAKETGNAQDVESANKELAGMANSNDPKKGNGLYPITFFFLGDLIDVVMDILNDNNESDRMELDFWARNNLEGKTKVVLGEVDIIDPSNPDKVRRLNIADFPISLELWTDFWVNTVVRKLKTRYTLKHFFRDITAKLIPNIFTTRYLAQGEVVNKIRVNVEYSSLGTDYPISVDAVESFSTYYKKLTGKGSVHHQLYIAKVFNKKPQKAQEIIYLYGSNIKPTWLSGNKKEDIAQGILYLPVGQEGTPLESISFSKADQPYYLEAKAEEGGILDDTTQLSEPYHCNFSVVGNTSIKPGRYVHISLPQLGGFATGTITREKILGIGGYFLINKVSNTLSANGNRIEWRTKADALWQTFGGGAPKPSFISDLNKWIYDANKEAEIQIAKNRNEKAIGTGASGIGDQLKIQTEKEELKSEERKAWRYNGASSVGSKL